MINNCLSELLTKTAKSLGYDSTLRVIKSNRLDLCDYQCDEVFKLSKMLSKNPIEIGNNIVNSINKLSNFNDYFSKVEFCMPGFINMTLSDKFIKENLIKMSVAKKFNLTADNEVKTYVIDYGGPNIAKPLHVGHMRPAIVGESIKRIIEYKGHKTISDAHLGDIGLPIGEVIYSIKKDNLDISSITLDYLNDAYPKMSALVKENEDIKKDCAEIIKEVQCNNNYIDLWKKICGVSLDDIKRLYNYLDVSFDYWYGESNAYKYIPRVQEYLISKNMLKDSNGAKVVYVNKDTDKKEYPPLIFQKSNGAYLYQTSELGTIQQRMIDFNPDYILYVTDFRQQLHFEQVFRVCNMSELVGDTKLIHLPHGTINGLDGKPYKTRDGETPKLDVLFNDVKDIFISKKESNKNMSQSDLNIIVNSILKFADLQNSRDKDYIFDINKFSDTNGKTGPYVLYTYLRMQKIVQKYNSNIINITDNIYNNYDRNLRICILDFEYYLDLAFNEFKPNYIVEYVYNICVAMNSFYQNNHIATINDNVKLNDWVSIIKLANRIIKEMLDLLIIDIPTEM